jgi:hypothetical protein
MATTNPAVYRLSIALIVFVLLTFILTIATYLFFSQYSKEQQTAKEARDALTKAQGEAGQAADEIKRLRDVIGADATAKIEAIESDLATLYQADFNGVAKEPKSYASLVSSIREEFRAINAARKDVEAAKDQQKKTADEAVAAATKARDDAEKAKADVEKERDSDRSKWQEDWKNHEGELAKRRQEKDEADAAAKRLKALEQRIAEAEPRIDADKRADFRVKDPMQQLETLLDSVLTPTRNALKAERRRARELESELLDTLVALGAGDDDDRVRELKQKLGSRDVNVVDEIDGRIVDIDSATRTVTILFPSVSRLREGLAFMVFPGGTVNPLVTDQKGVVKIASIEGGLVRAKILEERIEDPITPRDWVASRLWSPGVAPEVVVIGYVDLNRDGIEDRAALEGLLQRAGATIGPTVQPTTTIVIDAGLPGGNVPEPVREKLAQLESRRTKERDLADVYGHRVISVDEAVRLLGVDAAAGSR